MKTINYQILKSITHVGLILSAIVLSCEIQAKSNAKKGSLESDNCEGTRGRKLRKRSVDKHMDIQPSQQIEEEKSENSAKHKDNYPRRSKDKNKTRSKPLLEQLEDSSRSFNQSTEKLREKAEEVDENISNKGTNAVEGLGDVVEGIINTNVENESSRSSFLKAKDKFVGIVKSFFD